ncbi:MAG: hypothetical protein ABFD46_06070 [Armatimonadota bacterium]
MFCFRVKKHLIPYMEKTLGQKRMDAVARHLSKCARCSEELELIKRASGAFRSAKTPVQEPAADLWSRVEHEITAAPVPSARKLPASGLKFAGIAAAAVIILIAVISVSKIGVKPHDTVLRQTAIAQRPSDTKHIPLEPESPASVNTTLAKRTAAKDAGKSAPVSEVEPTRQSIANKHYLKHTDTALMASLPDECNSKVVCDDAASKSFGLNNITRSAGSSAVNYGNNEEKSFSENDILNNDRAANRAQDSGNFPRSSVKAGQDMSEVASAPCQDWMNNTVGPTGGAAVQNQKKRKSDQSVPSVFSNTNTSTENKQASAKYKRAPSVNPTPERMHLLVDAYARSGIVDGEIKRYEAALDKNPRDTSAMSFLTFAYARVGNQDARTQMARRLIAAVPDEASVWNRELGSALVALGNRAGAMSAWMDGLESSPVSDSAGILKNAASAGMIGDLTKCYQQKSSSEKAAASSLILASIYEFRGDFERAVKVRKKLTESFPKNQQYWLLLGEDLLKTGDKASAKTAFTKAAGMKDSQSVRALARKRLKELK